MFTQGQEVVLRNQTEQERFYFVEAKPNGYSVVLETKLNKDGSIKKAKPKKITIPNEDIVGRQVSLLDLMIEGD
jgi:hypothetical protein